MIVLVKLLLAHFIGDFLLQPKSWVKEKEVSKLKSSKFYFHILLHGILIYLLFWQEQFWILAIAISIIHGLIDAIKLYFQKAENKSTWFLTDQVLHLSSLFIAYIIFFNPTDDLASWKISITIYIYILAIIFISIVSAIVMRELMSKWTSAIQFNDEESLINAGKYIGILERVFVFCFIITNHWEGVGFLLTAKSVFRFGDLKESKDRKLTEYMLIGTLLSFGIAMATAMLTIYYTSH